MIKTPRAKAELSYSENTMSARPSSLGSPRKSAPTIRGGTTPRSLASSHTPRPASAGAAQAGLQVHGINPMQTKQLREQNSVLTEARCYLKDQLTNALHELRGAVATQKAMVAERTKLQQALSEADASKGELAKQIGRAHV